jgi:hypothetical protein
MNLIVDVAREMALEGHGGYLNPHDGTLYLLHVNAVAVGSRERAPMWGITPTGWLHDLVEDSHLTGWTLPMVRARFKERGVATRAAASCVHAVDLLSKPKDGSLTLQAYYEQIRDDDEAYACCVKQADIAHNFGRNHQLPTDDPKKILRMASKYSLGTQILDQRPKPVLL